MVKDGRGWIPHLILQVLFRISINSCKPYTCPAIGRNGFYKLCSFIRWYTRNSQYLYVNLLQDSFVSSSCTPLIKNSNVCDYIVNNINLHVDKAKIYPMSVNGFNDMWEGLQGNFHVLSTLLAVNYFACTLVSPKSHTLQ